MSNDEKIKRLQELAIANEDINEFSQIWDDLVLYYQENDGLNFSAASSKVWQICEDAASAGQS